MGISCMSRDESQGKLTFFNLEMRVLALRTLRILLFFERPRPDLEITHPLILWVLGVTSLGVQRLGHNAAHSPLSPVNVKKAWSYTSTPPYALVFLLSTGTTLPLLFFYHVRYSDILIDQLFARSSTLIPTTQVQIYILDTSYVMIPISKEPFFFVITITTSM
jgi:hypothetical protein